MTEAEWLASDDVGAMLVYVCEDRHPRPEGPGRKLRLFACACVREVWHLLTDERSRAAVEMAERYADGLATEDELAAAWDAAWDARIDLDDTDGDANGDAVRAAVWAADRATVWAAEWAATQDSVHRRQVNLLRDIVGNPYRAVTLDPAWITPTVLSLARAAYEGRLDDGALDPARLLVLSDALEEAGCPMFATCRACGGNGSVNMGLADAHCDMCADSHYVEAGGYWRGSGLIEHPLLAHLRSPGPHVRGCWAVDLILGKE